VVTTTTTAPAPAPAPGDIPSDAEVPQATTLKSGWLMKQQSSVNKNWSRKFFVLFPTVLCYYKDQHATEWEKKIYLDSYEMLIVDPEESEMEFCFKLTHPSKRTFYIHCNTKGEMLDWIIAIQDVIGM
jgi:hypothetical protein